uniref:Uncharacterized protein n=1 Tax=Angiostrongylus cantonensis TaxID=6313 RepID=A0A158P5Y8_ANGCA
MFDFMVYDEWRQEENRLGVGYELERGKPAQLSAVDGAATRYASRHSPTFGGSEDLPVELHDSIDCSQQPISTSMSTWKRKVFFFEMLDF